MSWKRDRSLFETLGAGLLVSAALAAGCSPSTETAAPREETEAPRTETAAPPAETVASVAPTGWPPVPERAVRSRVARVTDGDTIVLQGIGVGAPDASTGGRKARLIGVDTPEVFGGAECFGSRASAFTKAELAGREVSVDFDVGPTDRFGRALVYVWDEHGLFNARLVSEGYAVPLTVPPNVRYAELFVRLAREAREAGRGLWGACNLEEG